MRESDWHKIKVAKTFDRRYHYRKEGFKCERCQQSANDCFFQVQQEGRPPSRTCTHCRRLRKGCLKSSTQRVSRSPELGEEEYNAETSRISRLKSNNLQQDTNATCSHSGTTLGKRKARPPELSMIDHVSSSSRHDSDSSSEYTITPPPASTSSSRIHFKPLTPRTSSISERIVVRHIPVPSAFRISSSSSSVTHTRTRHNNTNREPENPIPSSIQQSSSSSSTSFNRLRKNSHETRPNPSRAPLNNPLLSSLNQPSTSSSTSLTLASSTNPPNETRPPKAHADTAVRQMEHVNATMVALYEALEGEIREAEEADRTRRARIYRIESAMKMLNRDVRAADNVLHTLNANGPISVEDHARLDPELNLYRQTLAMLQDRRVLRDRAAQERQRREKEHRDLLDDDLLSRLGKR